MTHHDDTTLTVREDDTVVALVHAAGTDEEDGAHSFPLPHLTLAAVVVVQHQAVQPLCRVVAHGVHRHVAFCLPPKKSLRR